MNRKYSVFAFLILSLLLAACGIFRTGAVKSLDDIQSAVIQIEVQGSFTDPEEGMVRNAAGRGSGFIIDPSGIAITNNHVVTGAALIQVWVGGESSGEALNARVLGVSECSDLAVIDIEGDGFSYLKWYEDDIKVGLDVYAAGFPLGDPEFTLTRGIISKESANGETVWSSVDNVLMHDASINPGNSGGPLVTTDGQVVGVNYMGSSEIDQFFAISSENAQQLIDILRGGDDYLSIGINGQAVVGNNFTGIWVASVQSGSPADVTGIKSGDVILSMEGMILSTDGTMADYCDILRTHDSDDILNVEVFRLSDGVLLEGQINGRQLEVASNISQATPTPLPVVSNTPISDSSSISYKVVKDDSGAVVVEVPTSWVDVSGPALQIEGELIGATISAAHDIQSFIRLEEPGIYLMATNEYDLYNGIEGLLALWDNVLSPVCPLVTTDDYEIGIWTGVLSMYSPCGPYDGTTVAFIGTPIDYPEMYLIGVQIFIIDEDDAQTMKRALETINIIAQLP